MKPVPPPIMRRPAAALPLLLVVAACLSFAQQTIPDLSEASLEQLGNLRVYSASKHLQDVGDAPSSVSVVTSDEIEKYGYRTLADILRTVRGFYVTSDRNYSYVGVRGFGRPGDYNTRVLLLIDGHRTNDNIYDMAMLGTEFPLDVDLIERIEIVRGPSSSLYGSNAFFAVINVITKKGSDLNGWELSFEPGSFDTYKGRASYGGQFKGMDMLLSGSFYDSAGQSLYFPEFNSPSTNHGITRNTDDDRYHDLLFTASWHGWTLQAVDDSREKGIPTGSFQTIFNDPRTRSVDQRQYLDLSYRKALRHGWDLGVRTYYDRYAYNGYWAYPITGLNVDYVRGQGWGSELQLSRTFLRKHRLTFGSELRNDFQQDQKNFDVSPLFLYVDDHHSSWAWAGYVQDEYAINDRLTLNAGVRYDKYTRYYGKSSPRLGLIYRPWAKTSLKLLYGSAFRVPNVYEAYYGTSVGGGYLSNPQLKPESVKNLEAVWEQRLGQRFSLSADVFRNYVDDLISLEHDDASGLLVFRNASKTRATGLELELQGRLPRGFEGKLSYSYTEGEDQATNQILVNSPRHLGSLQVTAPLYRQRLFASADAQYQGSRRTLSGNKVGAFPVFNVTLLGHALSRQLDLSASVYNLFDRRYFDVGPEEDQQDVIQQDGRNFRLKLTWKFGARK